MKRAGILGNRCHVGEIRFQALPNTTSSQNLHGTFNQSDGAIRSTVKSRPCRRRVDEHIQTQRQPIARTLPQTNCVFVQIADFDLRFES